MLVVDDERGLGRQRIRRETHKGTYVLYYATSGAEVLDRLAGEIEPTRGRGPLRHQPPIRTD